MSLTTPLTMPQKATEIGLEQDRADASPRQGSGATGGIATAFPLWKLEAYVQRQTELGLSDQWRAFITALNGSIEPFYGRDLTRPLPLLYIKSGLPGGFDGIMTSWSQALNTAGNPVMTINKSSMPNGFTLSLADYIGLKWTNGLGAPKRSLHRTVEVAVAASGVLSVEIRPAIPNWVPGTAIATLVAPDCIMRQQTAETKIGRRDNFGRSEVTFVAFQDLRP